MLGDPSDPATDVGPVIDRASCDRIDGMVRAAVGEGAVVATGGRAIEVDGLRRWARSTSRRCCAASSTPTASHAKRCSARCCRCIEIGSFDEAIDVVNDSRVRACRPLIYTRDVNHAMRAVHRIDTGIVYVNAPTIGAEIHLPFGGDKHTGNGFREAGKRGLEQFSEVKSVYIDFSGQLQKAQIDNRAEVGDGGPR